MPAPADVDVAAGLYGGAAATRATRAATEPRCSPAIRRPCADCTSFHGVIASRLAGFGTSIFAEMSALAVQTGAINLGQGFPDEDGPAAVLEAAQAAIRNGHNQYAPLPGVPALREAIAEHQQRFYGIELDPVTEVQVTMGATEAITAAVLGLCEPGDEVLAFDPTYDSYTAAAAMTGARLVPVPLHPPEWAFDPDELAALDHPAHARDPRQLAAQPDRPGALARGARADRDARASSTT